MNKYAVKIFRPIWRYWSHFTHTLMAAQTLVLFTAFYFFILWPVGIIARFFSDPLNTKNNETRSTFLPWDHPDQTIQHLHKQY